MQLPALLLWLIPLPPLLVFVLIILFTRKYKKVSHIAAISAAAISSLAAMLVFLQVALAGKVESAINWLPVAEGWLSVGVAADPLTAVTLFFVAITILMIFIYSVGYHNYGAPKGGNDKPGLPPHGASIRNGKYSEKVASVEPLYSRFFALISLFAFAMYLLVVTDNLLTLYIGWEVMGFCSYMLIGFWYAKPSARDAAVKAFMTTRVGDVFMLIGLAGFYKATGTLNYHAALLDPAVMGNLAATPSGVMGLSVAGLLGLLLFIGIIGKSAQFPLHVWLPDAMEGPTPVSAMIHAATMVSAGIYLGARIFPLISAGWDGHALTPTMSIMAFIGAFTALFAATIALAQHDIKRVLAYSTISQLGYMVAALGIGAYTAAVFHLVTHAFFKALLFLGAGSVIHGMEHGLFHSDEELDPQDMFEMGGLRERMPLTFWTFLAGGLALSGFPLITAGFWSKDEILAGAFGGGHLAVFITLSLAALLTSFYTARQITLTFLGQPRSQAAAQAHESKRVMTIPLIILAVFAIGFGWLGIPKSFPLLGDLSANWFAGFVGGMLSLEEHPAHSNVPLMVSILVSLFGLWAGWFVHRGVKAGAGDPLQRMGFLYRAFKCKYGIDELYQLVFIDPAKWVAEKIAFQLLDRTILDGAIHTIGRASLALGVIIRQFIDIPLWNKGLTDGSGMAVRQSGQLLRRSQTGRIQQYMLTALVTAILAGIAVYLGAGGWK